MSADLRRRIAAAEAGLQSLRQQLAQAEVDEVDEADEAEEKKPQHTANDNKWPLAEQEYDRYARQLILPSIGVAGQLALKNASIIIIGAGGLGCPAALYLAGAGVGRLTIVDGDTVETSNLHRQIGHTTARVGMYKVDSLVAACRARNPLVEYVAVREHVTVENVERLLRGERIISERSELNGSNETNERSEDSSEDSSERSEDRKTLVLDCTDHAAIRYLVSDACVRMGVSLVSAAALRTDGQLAVLNWPVGRGPCYRCVFPRPPPAASQTSCAEGGVLGPVVGVMGVLQALEAIRVLTTSLPNEEEKLSPTLLLFSAGGGPSFRTVRLRGKRADCFACGEDAPLKMTKSLEDGGWPDYVQFCGGSTAATQTVLSPEERVSVQAYREVQRKEEENKEEGNEKRTHWLLDVREKEFYNMGSLDGAVNIPFSQTKTRTVTVAATVAAEPSTPPPLPAWLPEGIATDTAPIYLVCRVGNDSQVVARQLKTLGLDREGTRFVGDVKGGLLAWKKEVDSTLPFV
ncbi:hypothetical protein SBRCBS47491_000875 [Sporothrix bragantina]|uniref:Adenylyltransferase and sulfurtransferase uba4 n=1 Tax=Sporothrix bragantina TaxID=671064 RepID=A0ABP0AU14_9PEZI